VNKTGIIQDLGQHPVQHPSQQELTVQVASSLEEAISYLNQGYCPIECAFGNDSVIDELELDHHGNLDHLESVSLRAYRDFYGQRASDPRFVVRGSPDFDNTFAIGALMGILPKLDERYCQTSDNHLEKKHPNKTMQDLVELIDRLDRYGDCNLLEAPQGEALMLWQAMTYRHPTSLSYYSALNNWIYITTHNISPITLKYIHELEIDRQAKTEKTPIESIHDAVGFVKSNLWGFNHWYSQKPIIVQFIQRSNTHGFVRIGIKDHQTAEKLLGPGGLKNIYANLTPKGWGGSTAIGGGPVNILLSESQVRNNAMRIGILVQQHLDKASG